MGELISLARERAVRRPAPAPGPVRGSAVHDPAVRDSGAQDPAVRDSVVRNSATVRTGARGPAAGRDPLWREVSGAVLRDERRRQGRTLADVAGRAGMSVQHLSEVERGRKEASSEMLAAAAGSLGLGLAEFVRRCALNLAGAAPTGPVLLAA